MKSYENIESSYYLTNGVIIRYTKQTHQESIIKELVVVLNSAHDRRFAKWRKSDGKIHSWSGILEDIIGEQDEVTKKELGSLPIPIKEILNKQADIVE